MNVYTTAYSVFKPTLSKDYCIDKHIITGVIDGRLSCFSGNMFNMLEVTSVGTSHRKKL